jgi:hypothetical protein
VKRLTILRAVYEYETNGPTRRREDNERLAGIEQPRGLEEAAERARIAGGADKNEWGKEDQKERPGEEGRRGRRGMRKESVGRLPL